MFVIICEIKEFMKGNVHHIVTKSLGFQLAYVISFSSIWYYRVILIYKGISLRLHVANFMKYLYSLM